MTLDIRVLGASVLVAAALLGVGAACGGDDEESSDATASASLSIQMDDYSFDPMDATTEAGSVSITADNVGTEEHELEIFETDADPSSLPVSGDEVDTEALEDTGAEEIGELEAEPGESETKVFDLAAGRYIMICNVPGHYEEGMWGTLTVE